MSPPQKPAPSPHPPEGHPYGASPTDSNTFGPPPAKRQRLSPDPRSPQASYANGTYHGAQPNVTGAASNYGNPYAPAPIAAPLPYSPNAFAGSPQQSQASPFNAPDPYVGARQAWPSQPPTPGPSQYRPQNASSAQSREMMPPPPRPNREEKEERAGVDDINDALFNSGVNLKDEENYLHTLYNNRHTGTDSFGAHQGSSFGSSNLSQSGSFGLLTQGTSFTSQPNGAGAGTLGPAVSQDSVEEELRHKRTAAARKKAELDQHQLNNPFLLGNVLRTRFDKIAKENGVRLDVTGLYILQPEAGVIMNGDNSEGAVVAKAGSKIETNAPFADVLSLLSLASGERARGLLDDAYSFARARRYSDQGRVPIEFKDIAMGNGESRPEEIIPDSVTGTSWDHVPDFMVDRPQTTVAFQSAINEQLHSLVQLERGAEKSRAQKREARRKAAEATTSTADDTEIPLDSATPIDPSGSAPGTPAEQSAVPSQQPPKLSKKELARQQKERTSFTEAQAATTTNQTAAMMAMGRKGNKYSWMSGGAASMPTNRFAKPAAPTSAAASGTVTPVKRDGARTPVGGIKKNGLIDRQAAGMQWGEWRETGEGGQGIQVRDWVLVLERDGREKDALEQVKLKMGLSADLDAPNAV